MDDAGRKARRQLIFVIDDLRDARASAGLPRSAVAAKLGYSGQLLALWEAGRLIPDPIQLVRWAAALGLDLPLRTYPAGSRLRDAAQLRLLARARLAIGDAWGWRTEVPVTSDPRDRRAFDAVLSKDAGRIGLEAVTRLTDAQAQIRAITLKQQAAGLERVVLVFAQTRHNALAVADAAPTLLAAFPATPRKTMRALRAGELPAANGFVLL